MNLPEIPESIIRYRKDGKLDRRFSYAKIQESIDESTGVSDYSKGCPIERYRQLKEENKV